MQRTSSITEGVRAEAAAHATARWAQVLSTLGYVVFYVYLAVAALVILVGLVTAGGQSSPLSFLSALVAAVLIGLLGAIIAAPLIAFGSYLTLGARRALTEMAREREDEDDDDSTSPAPMHAMAAPIPVAADSGGRERVRILTDGEKKQLARVAPPDQAQGWYADPLSQNSARWWNGTQWTGRVQ